MLLLQYYVYDYDDDSNKRKSSSKGCCRSALRHCRSLAMCLCRKMRSRHEALGLVNPALNPKRKPYTGRELHKSQPELFDNDNLIVHPMTCHKGAV